MFHDLYTLQGQRLPETPWQRYPRPQLKRDSFLCLNGRWDFTVNPENSIPAEFDREITVPFCPESLLSGVREHFPDGHTLCYRKYFTLPEGFHRGRMLLHFGAVDQIADIYVNQIHICHHGNISRTENPEYSETEYIFTVHMTIRIQKNFVIIS